MKKANKNQTNRRLEPMEIVERKGRYFIQCLDGEVELMRDDITLGIRAKQEIAICIESLKNARERWGVNELPQGALTYALIDDFFLNLKKIFQKMYVDASDKNGLARDLKTMCSILVSDLQKRIAIPFLDTAILNYELKGWEDMTGFVSLFELYAPQANQDVTGTQKPEITTNQFCKSMPLSLPRDHFKAFTENNSKNGKPFLTVEQYELFIETAFCGNGTITKQFFNVTTKEKLFIVKRFYEFYSQGATAYENTVQCRDKYIHLLTDNFDNWDYDQIKNNFGNKTKREW